MRLRLSIFAALAIVAISLSPDTLRAQEWPQRPIRLVVGYGAGGGTDLVARIVAQALQEKLNQSVVVENKVGASGILGADSVARADKDGYTLYLVNNAHIIVGVMTKKLPYDTIASFEPVGQVATGSLAIAARPDFPVARVIRRISLTQAERARKNRRVRLPREVAARP